MQSDPKPRKSKNERREELITAAIEVATEKGLDRLTVRDVASRAGVTSGLIHHYFSSIDELVNVVFEQIVRTDLETLHSGLTEVEPAESMTAFIRRSISPDRDAALTIWLTAWLAASRREGLREIATRLMASGAESLAAIIDRGNKSGVFQCEDALASAQRILTVCDGILIQRALNFGAVERLGIFDFMRETIESEIHASL